MIENSIPGRVGSETSLKPTRSFVVLQATVGYSLCHYTRALLEYSETQNIGGCDEVNESSRPFQHPFFRTLGPRPQGIKSSTTHSRLILLALWVPSKPKKRWSSPHIGRHVHVALGASKAQPQETSNIDRDWLGNSLSWHLILLSRVVQLSG